MSTESLYQPEPTLRALPSLAPELTAAREAVRTLLRYAGEDPTRDGLLDTPDRVLRSWRERPWRHRGGAICVRLWLPARPVTSSSSRE